MASRPVHWYEGMFLRPQHFQAADRHAREALRDSEDWYRPANWGLRAVEIDREAIANAVFVLRSCQARFKDGTKVRIPEDCDVKPIELRAALAANPSVTVQLAVPSWHANRSNVDEKPLADGPRYWVNALDSVDENTGSDETSIEYRQVQAKLMLSTQDPTGYEVLPLGRIRRSAAAEAPPELDPSYVPPILALDAWPRLYTDVQSIFHQIGAKIDQFASQTIDRAVSFDSQVPGDAERLLKLAALNSGYSVLQTSAFGPGIHPSDVYRELARIVGQLAVFSSARRSPELPPYDHETIGPCYAAAFEHIRRGLGDATIAAFEKRYFEKTGERLQVALESQWLTRDPASMFLGVETELNDQECQTLLDSLDMRLGSGAQVEAIFQQRVRGLRLQPVKRPPRQLPAGAGVVYYQVERNEPFWRDVTEKLTLALRMNLARAQFRSDKILTVAMPNGSKTTNLQFALFVI